MRSNLKNARNNASLVAVLFLSVMWGQPAKAQSQDTRKQDIQELKDKLQQLEQMMGEVKGKITVLEGQPGTQNSEAGVGESKSGPNDALVSSVVNSLDHYPGAHAAAIPTVGAHGAQADQKKPGSESTLDTYGFAMTDAGYNFGAIDPAWFDVVRPTKLPAFANEFGPNGQAFFSVRQTRFGVKSSTPTSFGDLKTIFEFELFGTGVDAGQTTFRLRHAWGEMGHFGVGQTWSPFMDPDVFPNSIDYWGPNGMVFFRNVQFRWTPWQTENSNAMISVERPGASADGGLYADRIELQNIRPRFRFPDIAGHVRWGNKRGHIQVSGIVRDIKWDDLLVNDP